MRFPNPTIPVIVDLPTEILSAILQDVGPTQLRRTAENLLVCRRWYQLALPIYLSGLDLSSITLSAWSLIRFPSTGLLFDAIAARTLRLSIRIVGHCCRTEVCRPWFDNEGIEDDSSESDPPGFDCGFQVEGSAESTRWDRELNRKLGVLAASLPNFVSLNEFHLQASGEELDTRRINLSTLTLQRLLESLPATVDSVTLDTCGAHLISDTPDSAPSHICQVIAQRLSSYRRVRLRMRRICPELLKLQSDHKSNLVKLERLTIKLNIPTSAMNDYGGCYDAEACDYGDQNPAQHPKRDQKGFRRAMICAMKATAKEYSLAMARVSFRDGIDRDGIDLVAVDCLAGRLLFVGSDIFCYEDDGNEWDPWEEDDTALEVSLFDNEWTRNW
ncbi:hypothetical protein MMC18_009413 [Xylographa bjoerkii]|nr:hypothetical protein [Xylographa bjoerkii]